jgi:hypothetical protein
MRGIFFAGCAVAREEVVSRIINSNQKRMDFVMGSSPISLPRQLTTAD